ncbi:hypothetical protein EN829_013190 [Mesorhizobium sp. M00.F.Ca.ET.186.01.1.1]|nr:hypothetical protein EN848_16235 [bacterium M00.F.Ca.ET.205.01.1.1]TGU52654.1 hypothetical protein EN795_13160 [bacterium M00.F.Ca.ET.152.01.1.1]TGV35634.1 hypothetical protein EN829_013190 [Mesorhizobium sp. M00.F.Ca.ET.186.01.1.1]TGZ43206.1 hypothetical protein EN805_08770 [bacterium M00.F.Ca.ET.162.01.1.1]
MARPATAAVRLLTGEREPCRVATSANIDVDAGGLLVIDGVQTEVGDRILVKNQTDGSENGIYTVSAGQWYRAADARASRTMQKGTTVQVQEGSVNADKEFIFDTLNPVIGDHPVDIIDYVQKLASRVIATFGATWAAALAVTTYAEAWIVLKLNGSLSTRALIKALVPQAGMSVLLTEANRVGNFVWTPGVFSAHVAADPLEGRYLKADSIAAASGAWVRDEDPSTIFARRFGTAGDGMALDHLPIQAAVNLGKFLGSGAVVISSGDFKTTVAITSLASKLKIIGHGTATRIKPATVGQDCFVFGDGTNLLQHAGVSNLEIAPTAQIEAAVRAKYFFWFEADRIKVSGSHNVGFEIEKGPGGSYLSFLRDCFTDQSANYGASYGRFGTGSLLGAYLYNTHLNGAHVAGLFVASMSGMVWAGGEALGCERAIVLSPDVGQQVRACLFSSLFLDTPHSEVVRLELLSTGRRISTISFNNLSMNSSVTAGGLFIIGLAADPTLVDQIRINACEVTLNCTHGLYATYCTDIDIDCSHFISNGQPGVGDGMFFDTGVTHVRVNGGSSNGGGGLSSSQLWGIVNASAGNTGVVITGMNVAGNVTGGISDAAAGTIVRDCPGAKTFNKGIAQMLIATSSVIVTHGLAFTPAVQDITITNMNDPGASGAQRLWVSATTATNFTVSTNAALASGHFFGWTAGVKGN